MKLHHFIPHASTLALALSSLLAGAFAAYALRREKLAVGASEGAFAARVQSWFARGVGRSEASKGRSLQLSPTGNQAFDSYRAETLRKLDEEAAEFAAYLENLRRASDRAEFEAFVAKRKAATASSAPS